MVTIFNASARKKIVKTRISKCPDNSRTSLLRTLKVNVTLRLSKDKFYEKNHKTRRENLVCDIHCRLADITLTLFCESADVVMLSKFPDLSTSCLMKSPCPSPTSNASHPDFLR